MANSCVKAKSFFGILKKYVKGFTLKPLSCTRWESRVDSVKAIRFQIKDVKKALKEVSKFDLDSMIRSEAASLASHELGKFEFLLAPVIWFDLLSHVNVVSKQLQTKDMQIDVAIRDINSLISFFKEYRETSFPIALERAKEIATELKVDPQFPHKREKKKKKQFDESTNDMPPLSEEESFRVDYFLYIVDQAISSLEIRFEQYQNYKKLFSFMFTSDNLHSLDETSLRSSCMYLENALKSNEQSDIDGISLFSELQLAKVFMPSEKMKAIENLNYLKDVGFFPNAVIAYRIFLTIPVTVASAERSFSKLKLVKSYLRSTMSQERLNGLAMIAIENDMAEKVSYNDLIDDFASKNARRVALFK
ncbi:hypothetical protein OROMI_017144 [Orobanche minor]